MAPPHRLFLIDGSALAYRSHFAFVRNPLVNSKGVNTSAAYGFTMTLRSLLEKEQPTHIAVVFDPRGKTFRHVQYAEYKATRDKTPEELVDQLPAIKEIVAGFGVPVLEKEGFEADDVIGTLAVQAAAAGWDVLLVSGDKDFMQLISPHIQMYNIMKTGEELVIIDEAGVEEKFGVPPNKVIDVLALMGDSSDNVPGVPGIGPKTATKLILEHGDLEAILSNPTCVTAKAQQKKIADHIDQARLSQDLVTIRTNVELEVGIEDLVLGERDSDTLAEHFREFEFRNLLDQVSAGADDDRHEYVTIRDRKGYDALLDQLRKAKSFTVDTETTALDERSAELVGFSFCFETRQATYLPVNLEQPIFGEAGRKPGGQGDLFDEPDLGSAFEARGDLKRFIEDLRPVLENPAVEKCGQNLKYDLAVLANYGVELRGIGFDTMIASYLLTPDLRQHNLDFLSLKYLNYRKIPTSDLIGKGRSQKTMAEVPIDEVGEYACEDVDICLRLREVLEPQLESLELRKLFDEIEMPLVPVLGRMEGYGIAIDREHFARLSKTLGEQIVHLERDIHALAGEPFNINSPRQLGAILFDKLELQKITSLKRVKKTKTGYATDQSVLEVMAPDHPLPAKLLEYRQLTKLKSTYVDALPQLVHPRTGRIHTSFKQTVAATGRLSSADPNLQNIPIRTEIGRELRKAFIPEPGWKMISADYSQIELRLMAHLSDDPKLREAFESGADIHAATASLIFGYPLDEVTPEIRSRAKSINFGVLYGMGPQRLARETGMTFQEAKTFIEAYFLTYPKVKEFIDQTIEKARRQGYVTTLLGRRRYIAEIDSSKSVVRSNAENAAINTPLQGSAADLIKKAMIAVDRRIQDEKLQTRMLLQVHDELVLESPVDEVETAVDLVRKEMTDALELSVPVIVDVGIGDNWYEAH